MTTPTLEEAKALYKEVNEAVAKSPALAEEYKEAIDIFKATYFKYERAMSCHMRLSKTSDVWIQRKDDDLIIDDEIKALVELVTKEKIITKFDLKSQLAGSLSISKFWGMFEGRIEDVEGDVREAMDDMDIFCKRSVESSTLDRSVDEMLHGYAPPGDNIEVDEDV